jgi:peptidoglycan/xylan/chitin deacetylase (PgdA/CDA1 family)
MILLTILLAVAPVNIALTVDDLPATGPETPGISRLEIARRLIATFHKHKVPRVFGFVNGKTLEKQPELWQVLRVWRDAGFPLGNHTYAHVDPNQTPLADYLADIARNEPALTKFGYEKVFRYPFLAEGDSAERRTKTLDWLREHGYRKADVSIDFDDWAWERPWARCTAKHDEIALGELRHTYLESGVRILQRARTQARAIAGREISHVLLLHIGAADADQMDALLTSYEAAGAHWVSLEEAQKDPIYAEDPGFVTKWGWTLLDRLAKARAVKIDDNFWPDETRLEKICN